MLVTILVILGVVLIIIGAILIIKPPKPEPEPEPIAEGLPDGVAKLIEQVVKLLERFEKRFVPGVFMMLVGLALLGFGAWFEAQDAKDAAESAGGLLLVSPALIRRRNL
jgi:uncharacterized membrane protein